MFTPTTSTLALLALTRLLQNVCPIDGVSVGPWETWNLYRATWRVDFRSEASQTQRAAAQNVLAAFDPTMIKEPLDLDDVLALLVKRGMLTQKDVDDAKAAKS